MNKSYTVKRYVETPKSAFGHGYRPIEARRDPGTKDSIDITVESTMCVNQLHLDRNELVALRDVCIEAVNDWEK